MTNSIVVKNIYYMLSYAFKVLKQDNYSEIESEQFDNVHDLLGEILSKGIAQQLKQGLYKEYINVHDNLYTLRGKIDIQETINNRINNRIQIFCEYDELSENNIYNQIIKSTVLMMLRKTELRQDIKDTLKKEMLMFSNISEVDILHIRWNQLRFSKNNQNYRMLITICQFITEGLVLTTEDGKIKLNHFFDEQRMCRLYEKFILEFYRKEMPVFDTNASRIEWQIDSGNTTMLPALQSDIMIKYNDLTLIIDAKYYSHSTQVQYDKHTLHSGNVFQIFTYVKNEDVGNTGNVAGMLLYAKTDEDIVPDAEVIISGNKIMAKTLDLNCDFSQISSQLINYANSYFGINCG